MFLFLLGIAICFFNLYAGILFLAVWVTMWIGAIAVRETQRELNEKIDRLESDLAYERNRRHV